MNTTRELGFCKACEYFSGQGGSCDENICEFISFFYKKELEKVVKYNRDVLESIKKIKK